MNPENAYAGFVFLLSIGLGSAFAAHTAWRYPSRWHHGKPSLVGLTIALLPGMLLAALRDPPWNMVAVFSFGAAVCLELIVLGRLTERHFQGPAVAGPVTALAAIVASVVVGYALGFLRAPETQAVLLTEAAVAAPIAWLVGTVASGSVAMWKHADSPDGDDTRPIRL